MTFYQYDFLSALFHGKSERGLISVRHHEPSDLKSTNVYHVSNVHAALNASLLFQVFPLQPLLNIPAYDISSCNPPDIVLDVNRVEAKPDFSEAALVEIKEQSLIFSSLNDLEALDELIPVTHVVRVVDLGFEVLDLHCG